jgi:uncharacterized repeat protein (TIGR03803 family)
MLSACILYSIKSRDMKTKILFPEVAVLILCFCFCIQNNVMAQSGNFLYGVISGSIFHFDPLKRMLTVDHSLSKTGIHPRADLTEGENGKFYGMTPEGGANGGGVIFEWDPTTNVYIEKIDLDSISGIVPYGSLCLFEGKFYAMTTSGGMYNKGVIFEWDPVTNIYTKKIDFDGTALGSNPEGTLTSDGGKLYGMTVTGGTAGSGVIFEWDPRTNIYTKKIDFDDSLKGASPHGALTFNEGKFYGMTSDGGAMGDGVIFEWDPSTNTYIKKIDLDGITKGSNPFGSLTLCDNNFYGMTLNGGVHEVGVIFKWNPDDNTFSKKFDFATSYDENPTGFNPYGSFTLFEGKLYGMTYSGGPRNKGVIFEWDPSGDIYIEKKNFDNVGPWWVSSGSPYGSLALSRGKFYGMASKGSGTDENAVGFIFECEPSGNFTCKYDFSYNEGYSPNDPLVQSDGKMYGMAFGDGIRFPINYIFEWNPAAKTYSKRTVSVTFSDQCLPGALALSDGKFYANIACQGVFIEWDPVANRIVEKNSHSNGATWGPLTIAAGKFYGMNYSSIFEWDPVADICVKKIDFDCATTGCDPRGALTLSGGKFYGMTYSGGVNDAGVLFEWDPATNIYNKKIDLEDLTGGHPEGSLAMSGGKLYGMTANGGSHDMGVIFEWDPATNIYIIKIDFDGITKGKNPTGSLTLSNGRFYGITDSGGTNNGGVIFDWDPVTNMYNKLFDFDCVNVCAPSHSQFTPYIVEVPTLQAVNLAFTHVQNNKLTIGWTPGNGEKRAVFVKEGSESDSNPADYTTYTASTDWTNKGSQIDTSGYYCVYNGTDNSIILNGLEKNTLYTVRVFEYNGIPGTEMYNTSTSFNNPNSVQTSNRPDLLTTAPIMGAPMNSAIEIPVTVSGFEDISAFSLRLEYDPNVMTYTGYSNVNPQLSGILVNDVPVSDSLHKLMILWSDTDSRTLIAKEKLLDLDFIYLSGTTSLTWNNTDNDGSDCEYADAVGEPLTDIPTSQFYINGEVHLQHVYSVGGMLKYNNVQNTVLDLVKVILMCNAVPADSVLSNTSGYYEFAGIPNGEYTNQFRCTKSWSGVNATDALKVQRHLAGLDLFTEPVRLLASDVNKSGSISTTDVLKIKRRAVGMDDSFTSGDWVFAKPTVGGEIVAVNGDNVTQDFYGLCAGDVNGSKIPIPGIKSVDDYNIEYQGDIFFVPGSTVLLPVRIATAADISAISMVVQLSPGLFNVLGVNIASDSVIFNIIGDELHIAWSEIEGLKLNAGDTLFTLELSVNDIPMASTIIPFNLMEGCELADGNADPIQSMTFITPNLTQSLSLDESIASGFKIYPNPAIDKVTLSFSLPADSHIECYITDIAGKALLSVYNQEFDHGLYKNPLDLRQFLPGIYLVFLKSESTSEKWMTCKRLIIL